MALASRFSIACSAASSSASTRGSGDSIVCHRELALRELRIHFTHARVASAPTSVGSMRYGRRPASMREKSRMFSMRRVSFFDSPLMIR